MCRAFLRGKHSSSFLLFEDYSKIDEIGETLFSCVSGFLSYSESEMSGVFRASFLLSFILQIITFSALQQHQSPFSLIIKNPLLAFMSQRKQLTFLEMDDTSGSMMHYRVKKSGQFGLGFSQRSNLMVGSYWILVIAKPLNFNKKRQLKIAATLPSQPT